MLNLLVSLGIGIAVFFGVAVPVGWVPALLPGIGVAALAYFLLARRTSKQLDKAMPEVQKALMARRFDQAIAMLKDLSKLGRWQFLVKSSLDAQIGMIYYAYKQTPDQAVPYLEHAYVKQWQAKAMLAAWYYKKKSWSKMEQVFEDTLASNKKTSMLYSAYAWCEWKRGEKKKAMEILQRGQKVLGDDERIKANLLNLQNDKKLKMKPYAEEWWALLLERPPAQMATSPIGAQRGGKGRRATRRR